MMRANYIIRINFSIKLKILHLNKNWKNVLNNKNKKFKVPPLQRKMIKIKFYNMKFLIKSDQFLQVF
jgi:hypothetical protein